MFIVLMRFSANKDRASEFMDAHNAWIRNGFDDGIFLLVGGINPGPGGGVVAHNTTLEELQDRVNEDPFVSEEIVKAEIIDLTPAKTDERLNFLLG